MNDYDIYSDTENGINGKHNDIMDIIEKKYMDLDYYDHIWDLYQELLDILDEYSISILQECKFKDFYNFIHGGNEYIKSLQLKENKKLNILPVQFMTHNENTFSKNILILGKKKNRRDIIKKHFPKKVIDEKKIQL